MSFQMNPQYDKPQEVLELEEKYGVEIRQFFDPIRYGFTEYYSALDVSENKILLFRIGNDWHQYIPLFDMVIQLENYKRKKSYRWN